MIIYSQPQGGREDQMPKTLSTLESSDDIYQDESLFSSINYKCLQNSDGDMNGKELFGMVLKKETT